MVLLAISVRKRRPAALYSAFTRSCNFLADCRDPRILNQSHHRHVAGASCCRRRRRLVLAAETVRVILALPRALTPLVIPDQADYCDEHGRDRPGGNASDQNEEEKLGDVIPGCFSAEEFTA